MVIQVSFTIFDLTGNQTPCFCVFRKHGFYFGPGIFKDVRFSISIKIILSIPKAERKKNTFVV
jgi:hypothetical protein